MTHLTFFASNSYNSISLHKLSGTCSGALRYKLKKVITTLKKGRSRPGSKNYVSVGRRNEKSFIRIRDFSAKIEKVLKSDDLTRTRTLLKHQIAVSTCTFSVLIHRTFTQTIANFEAVISPLLSIPTQPKRCFHFQVNVCLS